jgi:hypothetical protein
MFLDFVPNLCIYHHVVDSFPCPDGLAAAWVVKRRFPNVQCFGMTYSKAGKHETFNADIFRHTNILAVDFSFDAGIVKLLINQGCRVKLIDHHKSYLKSIVGSHAYTLLTKNKLPLIYQDELLSFNSKECGATMTWLELFPDEPLPPWLVYIRDNDLFTFTQPDAELVHYGMAKMRRTFELFDRLQHDCEQGLWTLTRKQLSNLGQVTVNKNLIKFEKILAKSEIVDGIPYINLNDSDMALKSRIAYYANNKYKSPFAVILNKSSTHVRVKGKGIDLLELFKEMDVAGHDCAASFPWNSNYETLKRFVSSKVVNINL